MSSETKIGNYFIERPIGRGGMGVVYKGRHATLPREVAIKSVSARGGTHDLRRLRSRFEREAYVQSQLDHPSIVKIYDYIVSEQTYHIVMEYVEGRSLAELLKQQKGGPLETGRALDLFEQILAAIAYAHSFVYRDEEGTSRRGIIHRDLKPANIMVASGDQIKITDFGIVKLVGADTSDTSGVIYGSPHYVSPEQAEGLPLDQRSDIYSLGVILYEMLTGRPPFGGEGEPLKRLDVLRAHINQTPPPPSRLNPELTPEVERVVCRALEKKPERRFATAADFLRAVRQARGRETSDAAEADALANLASAVADDATTHDAEEEQTRSDEHPHRDTYETQPLRASRCDECGSDVGAGDTRCRTCGHDLRASPATVNLTRRDTVARRRTQALVLAGALAALALLSGVLLYSSRRQSSQADESPADGPPPRNSGAQVAAQHQTSHSTVAGRTPPPSSEPVDLRSSGVKVDSSFDGYDAKPLTDGVTDVQRIAAMRYNRGNWASAETPLPHWIELDFGRPTRVTAVYVFWGFDRNRFLPSRRVELQTPDESDGWRTVATLEPGEDYDRAAFDFAPFEASRLRIFQPAQQGPRNRPFVMWVREVQVYRAADADAPPRL